MIGYVFPGQGSQHTDMGGDLFPRFPSYVRQADEVLGYSIEQLCRDSSGKLTQTAYTQPAMYVVNALSYLARVQDSKEPPAVVAGHSLGEYSALFAAGVFDFRTGLELVRRRGELMGEAQVGGMAAVLGLDLPAVEGLLRTAPELADLDLANINAPTQVVISGPSQVIADARAVFEKAGARVYIPLNVGAAFHSRYMRSAREKFEPFVRRFAFAEPSVPVIANADRSFYTAQSASRLLVEQIVAPVHWMATVQQMANYGVSRIQEIGPGEVLTRLSSQILGNAAPTPAVDARPPRATPAAEPPPKPVEAGDRAFEALRESILEVLPGIDPSGISPESRLRDLQANSLDRAEVLMTAMQKLQLKMPLIDLAAARSMGGIAEIFRARLRAS